MTQLIDVAGDDLLDGGEKGAQRRIGLTGRVQLTLNPRA